MDEVPVFEDTPCGEIDDGLEDWGLAGLLSSDAGTVVWSIQV